MTTSTFHLLCQETCDLLGEARFPLPPGPAGTSAFRITRRGVDVNILHFPQQCPDHAHLLVDFGPVPLDDPRAGSILLTLLDLNYVLPQAQPPAVGRNPVTGDIVLRCVYPLADASAEALLRHVDEGVALALQWRAGYFLQAEEATA